MKVLTIIGGIPNSLQRRQLFGKTCKERHVRFEFESHSKKPNITVEIDNIKEKVSSECWVVWQESDFHRPGRPTPTQRVAGGG